MWEYNSEKIIKIGLHLSKFLQKSGTFFW